MSAIGQVVPLPFMDRVPVQASPRVINLHPDSRRVWGHRLYRMSSTPTHEGLSYGVDAGLSQEALTGQLIDVFA